MRIRNQLWRTVVAVSLMQCMPYLAQAQQAAGHPAVRNLEDLQLVTATGFPACVRGAVQSGDPEGGPFLMVGELETGCTIPWHWHTPNEHLMMVSGEALIEMRNGESLTLRAGGFALMPSRHVHQFRCISTCTLYVYSDAPLDIRYVDAQGREISPEVALRAVSETNPEQR
jgi:quercetin dioxygenase-like cupin family protein